MKQLAIPYGKKRLMLDVPEENILDIIYPRTISQQNSRKILTQAMNRPLGDRTLREFLTKAERVLFIINDATRPTKTSDVLDLIEDTMKEQSRFLIATGAHRAPSTVELKTIFGERYSQYENQILIHDSKDNTMLQNIGKTRHGNELWLNQHVVHADHIFVISSVEPHYFAGYTGGRKSFLPGIAAYNTIENNHKFALHARARSLNLAENPVHEEMLDCVKALGQNRIFSLQMVLDNDRSVSKAFSGPLDSTFEMATQYAKDCFSAEIPTTADVVVTVSRPPFDVNLYQTLKAIEHARLALNEGGTLIVVSPCPEGLGPDSFARLFKEQTSMARAVEHSKKHYRLGDHNALNLMTLIKQARFYAITDIDDRILENAGITPFRSLQRAIERAMATKGRPNKILILTNGALTVPIVQKTA
jgi:nickel-dependent lactate racemase